MVPEKQAEDNWTKMEGGAVCSWQRKQDTAGVWEFCGLLGITARYKADTGSGERDGLVGRD